MDLFCFLITFPIQPLAAAVAEGHKFPLQRDRTSWANIISRPPVKGREKYSDLRNRHFPAVADFRTKEVLSRVVCLLPRIFLISQLSHLCYFPLTKAVHRLYIDTVSSSSQGTSYREIFHPTHIFGASVHQSRSVQPPVPV